MEGGRGIIRAKAINAFPMFLMFLPSLILQLSFRKYFLSGASVRPHVPPERREASITMYTQSLIPDPLQAKSPTHEHIPNFGLFHPLVCYDDVSHMKPETRKQLSEKPAKSHRNYRLSRPTGKTNVRNETTTTKDDAVQRQRTGHQEADPVGT